MPLKNTSTRYGAISKLLHWTIFLLFMHQFIGANLMSRIGRDGSFLGMGQNFLYNWHKSIGLVVIVVALARVIWRRTTPLPDWCADLSPAERAISHRLETLLYWLMFVLPVSGYLFVMFGGYGVKLFGVTDLPNPFGKWPPGALIAWISHIVLAYGAVVVISWHVGLGLKKQCFDGARFLRRMLPFGRS
ncbi:MAG: cytochrome b [Burkholderiaceae bacterium]